MSTPAFEARGSKPEQPVVVAEAATKAAEGNDGNVSLLESEIAIGASQPLIEARAEKTHRAEFTAHKGKTSSGSSIPVVASEPSWVGPCFAILIQLATLVLIITATTDRVWFGDNEWSQIKATVSRDARIIYTTGLAVVASLVTTITTGQIRTLWLRKILVSKEQQDVTARTRSKASVLVGQGSLIDQIKRWHITLSFVIAGLTTTAIVAGLSMTSNSYVLLYNSIQSVDHIFGPLGDVCLIIDGNTSSSGFVWQLSNGSTLGLSTSEGSICTPRAVSQMMPNSFQRSVDARWAYTVGGISIGFDAPGIPVAWGDYLTPSFGDTFGSSVDGWQSSTNCLPVVSANPVQCRATGNVTASQNEVSVSAGGCNISTPIYSVDPTTQGASAAGACTDNLEVGMATVVFGSVNQHAPRLAELMGDKTYSLTQGPYSVACSIDIKPSVSFRQILLSLGDSGFAYNSITSAFQVSGDTSSSCTPLGGVFYPATTPGTFNSLQQPAVSLSISHFLTDNALAVGASASWDLLNENRYADGWCETLFDSAISEYTYWNNSQNHLEDILGVASAMALGMFWGNFDSQLYNQGIYIGSGEVTFTGVKLGPSSWWSIIYIGPSLFSIIAIVYLLFATRSELFRWDKVRKLFNARC